MTPPKLTGDTPVVDVFHPVDVDLAEAFGYELHRSVANHLKGRLGERLHFDEPLIGGQRLYRRAATVARANVVLVGNGLDEIAFGFQVRNQGFAAGIAIHTFVFARVGVHGSVVVHDLDLFEVIALTHEEVVGVMGGCDLHTARSEADLYVLVGNDGDLAVDDGKDQGLADEVLGCLVVGVDRHGGISEHGFGTGSSHFHEAILALDGILDMPEMTVLLRIFHLCVRQGGNAVRTPVDDAVSAVDQALVVEIDEYLADGAGAALVHGKALS